MLQKKRGFKQNYLNLLKDSLLAPNEHSNNILFKIENLFWNP